MLRLFARVVFCSVIYMNSICYNDTQACKYTQLALNTSSISAQLGIGGQRGQFLANGPNDHLIACV